MVFSNRLPPFLMILALGSGPGVASEARDSVPPRFEYERLQMGSVFRIVIYAEDETEARSAAFAAFDRIEALEGAISDYRMDSELMEVIRGAWEQPVVVSPDLYHVIEESLRLGRLTSGALDITVKPLVELWRLAGRRGRLPSPEELREARQRTGHEKVLLNPRTRSVRFRVPGMKLDLGAVGKGYAADVAWALLADRGLRRSMIDAGGDLRVGDPPPRRSGWRIELEDHLAKGPALELSNVAVATSGEFYRFVEIEGVRYSHILDPRSGMGLRHRGTVTVIAPHGLTADGLATALSVLDPDIGLTTVGRMEGVEARITREAEDGRGIVLTSSGFPP
jgi:FAD:protein FMN transferase